jgi:hypothetical protein
MVGQNIRDTLRGIFAMRGEAAERVGSKRNNPLRKRSYRTQLLMEKYYSLKKSKQIRKRCGIFIYEIYISREYRRGYSPSIILHPNALHNHFVVISFSRFKSKLQLR